MRDKHHITEERNEGKLSRSVLKTSGTGDSLAEFNATTSTLHAWNGQPLQANREQYSSVRHGYFQIARVGGCIFSRLELLPKSFER